MKRVFNIFVLLFCILIIVVLSIEALSTNIVINHQLILNFQLVVCIVFIIDFFVRMTESRKKMNFFLYNIPLLLVSIPYINIADWLNIDTGRELHLILRTIPLIRGIYGLAIMIGWFTKNKIYNLFFSYLITMVGITYYSSIMFYAVEKSVNPMVQHYWSSLWWACMDVTTVGSNIYGVTWLGQFLAAILAGTGMMLFPIFTAYIIKLYENEHKKRTATK